MGRNVLFAVAAAAVATAAAAGAAQAQAKLWSYDPASEDARRLLGGITLEVEPGMLRNRVARLMSTRGKAVAHLERGGLSGKEMTEALGGEALEDNVYRIGEQEEGAALARALCRGSQSAYLVTGPVRRGRPLTVHVVGRWAEEGVRRCATLEYRWRGEWTLPDRRQTAPDPAPVRNPRGM